MGNRPFVHTRFVCQALAMAIISNRTRKGSPFGPVGLSTTLLNLTGSRDTYCGEAIALAAKSGLIEATRRGYRLTDAGKKTLPDDLLAQLERRA